MKRLVTATMALMLCGAAVAAPKPCEELKQEIEVKIQAARVNSYTTEIVPAGEVRTPPWWSAAVRTAAARSSTRRTTEADQAASAR